MSYLKIWIHLVWTTKNREPFLQTHEIRQKVFQHIRENAQKKGIYVDFINGYRDHVHCLISLGSGQTIDKIVMLLKGESSFWVNKNIFSHNKFEWQSDYFALSVSESVLVRTRNYIKNQEAHHAKKDFEFEYQQFAKVFDIEGLG
jgi:REP element-mobilizing transposase RayT